MLHHGVMSAMSLRDRSKAPASPTTWARLEASYDELNRRYQFDRLFTDAQTYQLSSNSSLYAGTATSKASFSLMSSANA